MKVPCVALLCLPLLASPASGQSLADVARKEEARRKTVKQPSKVYTNDDLRGTRAAAGTPDSPPSGASMSEPASSSPPAADVGATPPRPDAPAEPAKDEAYWRGRITAARAELERNKTYVDALQSRINALTADFVNRDDPGQRALIDADRKKAVAELDRLKTVIQQQVKGIADVEEEARRAGVPPGWLR